MEIKVSDTKVVITMYGETHESDFKDLVEMFNRADERERKKLAIVHFYGRCFKDITSRKKRKIVYPTTKTITRMGR